MPTNAEVLTQIKELQLRIENLLSVVKMLDFRRDVFPAHTALPRFYEYLIEYQNNLRQLKSRLEEKNKDDRSDTPDQKKIFDEDPQIQSLLTVYSRLLIIHYRRLNNLRDQEQLAKNTANLSQLEARFSHYRGVDLLEVKDRVEKYARENQPYEAWLKVYEKSKESKNDLPGNEERKQAKNQIKTFEQFENLAFHAYANYIELCCPYLLQASEQILSITDVHILFENMVQSLPPYPEIQSAINAYRAVYREVITLMRNLHSDDLLAGLNPRDPATLAKDRLANIEQQLICIAEKIPNVDKAFKNLIEAITSAFQKVNAAKVQQRKDQHDLLTSWEKDLEKRSSYLLSVVTHCFEALSPEADYYPADAKFQSQYVLISQSRQLLLEKSRLRDTSDVYSKELIWANASEEKFNEMYLAKIESFKQEEISSIAIMLSCVEANIFMLSDRCEWGGVEERLSALQAKLAELKASFEGMQGELSALDVSLVGPHAEIKIKLQEKIFEPCLALNEKINQLMQGLGLTLRQQYIRMLVEIDKMSSMVSSDVADRLKMLKESIIEIHQNIALEDAEKKTKLQTFEAECQKIEDEIYSTILDDIKVHVSLLHQLFEVLRMIDEVPSPSSVDVITASVLQEIFDGASQDTHQRNFIRRCLGYNCGMQVSPYEYQPYFESFVDVLAMMKIEPAEQNTMLMLELKKLREASVDLDTLSAAQGALKEICQNLKSSPLSQNGMLWQLPLEDFNAILRRDMRPAPVVRLQESYSINSTYSLSPGEAYQRGREAMKKKLLGSQRKREPSWVTPHNRSTVCLGGNELTPRNLMESLTTTP